MSNFLDKLQQAWQSQCSTPIDVNPDQLLKVARHERRVQFWVDIGMISFFLCVGVLMLGWAFRDIQKDWPWLISSASLAWVVGYILFDRWRRRRDAAHYDEPLLAHVEWSIKDIEHRMWLDAILALVVHPADCFGMHDPAGPFLRNGLQQEASIRLSNSFAAY